MQMFSDLLPREVGSSRCRRGGEEGLFCGDPPPGPDLLAVSGQRAGRGSGKAA